MTREIPVIFITADRELDTLVKGFQAGGVDHLTKPFQVDEIRLRVETHLKLRRAMSELHNRNTELAAEIARRTKAEESLATADQELKLMSEREVEKWGLKGFIGRSSTLQKILQDIQKLQNFPTSVLINGESGTGKELIARAIHEGGAQSKGRFVSVNCSAVPLDLFESLFFGHVKGAFTGAVSDRKGYFELADGGTLFLDEVGEMHATLQAKLLRVLEDGKITPVGAPQEKQIRARLIAASNIDFSRAIADGKFRQDLYFRLARYQVTAPPLRDRREDIHLLVDHFLRLFASELGLTVQRVNAEARRALQQYDFPGNIRELKNIIERALIESGGEEIQPEHLHFFIEPRSANSAPEAGLELPMNLEQAEELVMRRALDQTGGNLAAAARLLGVHRLKLYRRIKQR